MDERNPNQVYERNPQSAPTHAAQKPDAFRVAAIVVAVLLVVVALLVAFRSCSSEPLRDPNAELGQLDGKTDEEIQAELDRVVEEGMFNISIANFVEFDDGSAEGEVRIENVPSNRYLMKVEIVRDDTGETVYTSGLIEPNHHIQKAKLDVPLEAGEYPSTAVFYACDAQTEELVGQAAAKLTLKVIK